MSEKPEMPEMPELLPLGSAVQIEDDDGVYVIIARGFQKQEDGFSAGYKGVPYPQGAASGVREIVIRQSQIVKVLHRGHESEKDVLFAKELLANAKTPPKVKPVVAAEPDLTIDVSKPAAVSSTVAAAVVAPLAGSGAQAAAAVVGADPMDPFKELRDKGKRI